jgi:hypothetical protein
MAIDDMDDDLPDGTEIHEIDDDQEIEDTPDGGAIVRLDEDEGPPDTAFYDNLADVLPENTLNSLATQYLELIERDKEARKKRDEQYEEGIRRTGLGNDAPGGAQFQGATKVVHPMLTEVCVDFSSRSIKELYPADGPVKTKILGKADKKRMAKAERKADFMNWQLTTQCQGFRAELEQLLTQVPLAGAGYMKVTWDEERNRPDFLFIPIDDIYLPYAATNFYTAQRKTHVQYLTKLGYERCVRKGMYRDIDLISPGSVPEGSDAQKANDKVEGREDSAYNEDGLRTVFEIETWIDLEGDDPEAEGAAPYILTVDKTTTKVCALYRNWDEDDASKEPFENIVEFPFVPWRGAYPIGITHMIGGLSATATGAMRALLDSAHIANSQTLLKLKGGSRGGQSLNIQPTEVVEIEGALTTDDIRKTVMALPFNQPSAVLLQLLGMVVDTAKGVVRTTLDDLPDANENTPVGTTLARIEQGTVVFSAIHGRLHDAFGRVMRVLHRLNGMYLDDVDEKEAIGEVIATRGDFSGPMDIVPVSDPNIFSEAQRFAQTQAVAQRAQIVPQLYNARAVEERILTTLKVPDPQSLLAPSTTPSEENAVSENVKASLGRPITAFPEQDHIAHLKTHLAFMQSPVLGASQLIAPTFLPGMMNHIKEHIVLWYADEAFEQASQAYGHELETDMEEIDNKADKRALDKMIAEASLNVVQTADAGFASLPPIIQKAMAMMASYQPQPQDPAAAAAMADIAMREKLGEGKLSIEQQKLQLQQGQGAAEAQRAEIEARGEAERTEKEEAGETMRAMLKIKAEQERTDVEEEGDTRRNSEDNATAIQLAEMDIAAGKHAGKSLNVDPGP